MPEDPAVITIFRSRLRPGVVERYEPVAERMAELARAMPGFVECRSFTADGGERVTIVEFASEEDHRRWRDHPRHRAAQRRGREEFYEHYRIDVCRRIRHSAGPADG